MKTRNILSRPVWLLALLMLAIGVWKLPANTSNIVANPSFEASPWFLTDWQTSGSIGGTVNSSGYDGANWVMVSGMTPVRLLVTNFIYFTNFFDGQVLTLSKLSSVPTGSNAPGVLEQDLVTQAGNAYAIQFAARCSGATVRVLWDNQLIGLLTNAMFQQWTVTNFTAVATGSTTRLTFENVTPDYVGVELDDIQVTSLTEPAWIIAQPQSRSAFVGGAAAYRIVAGGTPPLSLQWLHEGSPILGATNSVLSLTNIQPADAGSYRVLITNAFGAVTSSVVALAVEPSPQEPLLVVQPESRSVAAGYAVSLMAVAVGAPELRYQWHRNGTPLAGRTNATLVLTNLTAAQAGDYHATVTNNFGAVSSLSAALTVTNGTGGGLLMLHNGVVSFPLNPAAAIYDTDGVTRLGGSGFVAQAYAGPSRTNLHAVGLASVMLDGAYAGFYFPFYLTLPDVSPLQPAYLQVRVWERSAGETYEAARALGGRYGCSDVMAVQCGGNPGSGLPPLPQAELKQTRGFTLQAGQPFFSTGRISAEPVDAGGVIRWSLTGEPGTTYVVEKRVPPAGWFPVQILRNTTGTVKFQEPGDALVSTVFYRARLLD